MSDTFFVGLNLTGVEDNGAQRPISRVTLLVDDENSVTAGNDTGAELTADCPYATQAIADAVLAQVKGYQYKMFRAEDAALDPSAELGDGVTAGSVYSVISRLNDDGSGYAGISAPGEAELEDEYPTGGPMTQAFNREIAKTRSQILKTADRITLLVENEIDGLNSKIDQTAEQITLMVESEIDGLEGRLELTSQDFSVLIQDTNQRISSIQQYVDNIELKVVNGSESSRISITSGNVNISSQTIQMTGLVSFTGLANGTTTINGACIQTGTIDAEYLDLTGAITFSDLSRALRDDINDAYAMAEDAQSLASDLDDTVGGWMYRGTTYIDGGMLMTGTVMASQLLGGTVGLLDAYERVVGGINITRTQTGDGLEFYTDYGGIRISAAGNFWVDTYNGSFGLTDSGVICKADCVPERSGWYTLGGPGLNWSDIYADNDAIITSDRKRKRDITYDLSAYDRFFDSLRPARYRLRDGRSGRTHLGLIAQDVEAALEDCGLTGMDFAGLVKTPREDGGVDYALRYGEFIPMLILKYQTLAARVAELERRIPS